MSSLVSEYPDICQSTIDLFGEACFEKKLPDLEQAYAVCEAAWERNLSRIGNTPIKYLLIGEAPPFPSDKKVSYFYETFDKTGSGKYTKWIADVMKVFSDEGVSLDTLDIEDKLKLLAQNQFLLVDSMPVAWPFKLKARVRKEPGYRSLIAASQGYFNSKLRHPSLIWAKDVRIAFAIKLNAEAFIRVTPTLTIDGAQRIDLNHGMIAAEKKSRNLPNKDSLKRVWGLC